jgi:hypothetical protein
MRIYLACTVRGDRSGVEVARLVAERLAALGHEILTGHLLQDDVDRREAFVGNTEVFERDVRWLDACDVLVAEASGSTYGVGFEVGYIVGRAPHTGQRAIVLYDARREATVSRMLSGSAGVAANLPVGGSVTLAYRSAEEAVGFLEHELSGGRMVEQAFRPAERSPAD